MIANLQAHYGFTRMPFGTAIPVDALSPPPPTRKPSPASPGSSPPAAWAR